MASTCWRDLLPNNLVDSNSKRSLLHRKTCRHASKISLFTYNEILILVGQPSVADVDLWITDAFQFNLSSAQFPKWTQFNNLGPASKGPFAVSTRRINLVWGWRLELLLDWFQKIHCSLMRSGLLQSYRLLTCCVLGSVWSVSYTHLTLPTICSV